MRFAASTAFFGLIQFKRLSLPNDHPFITYHIVCSMKVYNENTVMHKTKYTKQKSHEKKTFHLAKTSAGIGSPTINYIKQ